MKIHTPVFETRDGYTFLASHIQFEHTLAGVPDWLWFRVPSSLNPYLVGRSDPFVSALLILAMWLGEDIEIQGPVSPRLMYGLGDYQAAFRMWSPDIFKPIRIHAPKLEPAVVAPNKTGVASAFSGGVDSFYTLWTNLPQNQIYRNMAVKYILFAIGFDILLGDEARWQPALIDYTALAQRLGVEMLPIWTNIREFTDTVMGWQAWHWCFGSVLIGAAHAVANPLRRFYQPAGRTFLTDEPVGSLPQIDHFLSNEGLEIYHHGARVTRFEKIATIADWPEAQRNLRICWQNPQGLQNCGRCDKCLRTMISLDILDRLPQFQACFVAPLTHDAVRGGLRGHLEEFYIEDLLHEAITVGRDDLVDDLRYVMEARKSE
ncbi:MAG: hypothetical protein HY862_11120 [Chloroflexi bacterium]|nr:hypothetical protein [Chloroflexota bacterium]